MRLIPLGALLVAASLNSAIADPIPLAVNGAWTTLEDSASPTKMCGIQIAANGGRFTVFGTSDQQGVLRLGLRKSSWKINGAAVPIVIKFADDVVFNFNGIGSGQTIRADIPAWEVKSFIHHLTADDQAILTLPEGHEAPWRMDLRGTTPATLALGQCVDTTQIKLPPPFRAPQPVVAQTTPVAASPDANIGLSNTPTLLASQPVSPDQAAAIAIPSDTVPAEPANHNDEGSATGATDQYQRAYARDVPPPSESMSVTEPLSHDAGAPGLLAMGGLLIVSLIAGSIAFYFIPYIVGSSRRIENRFLLFITNLLFGWTVVGWFGCLLWAALAQSGLDRALYRKMLRDGG
jgi:hypothetical protein